MLLRYRGAVQAEFWRSLAALAALRGEAAGPEGRGGPQPVLTETKRTRVA